MDKIFEWFIARFTEPSTWAGIGVGAIAVGTALQSHATIYSALLAGVVSVIAKEKSA
jgi:hypothetical protein